ncbi:MAG: peptidoglycan-binding protein [Pseudobacteriovorax sp.]|nr:peptidoglycan-binding protein [Pseudobacteriovorax sp.]
MGKKDIDGVLGKKTYGAVKAYQKRHRLATGGLTYETIENLGVTI